MSRRRSGITDLAFSYPMLLTESIADGFGNSMWRGRLHGVDILELLGDTPEERVDTVVEMLRHSSDEEINEFLRIGQAAVMRVSQERAAQQAPGADGADGHADDGPSGRPRPQSAVERRMERRRAQGMVRTPPSSR